MNVLKVCCLMNWKWFQKFWWVTRMPIRFLYLKYSVQGCDPIGLEEVGNSRFLRLLMCCWWTKFGHQLSLVVHRFQLICQILSISLPDVSWFGRITLKAWCVIQRSFGGLLFKSCGRQKFGWFGSIHIEGGHGCFPVNRNLKEECFPFWVFFVF